MRVENDALLLRREFLAARLATAAASAVLLGARFAWAQDASRIEPFTYRAPQSALDDLKRRLRFGPLPKRMIVTTRRTPMAGRLVFDH
jgi:hypothetical protein